MENLLKVLAVLFLLACFVQAMGLVTYAAVVIWQSVFELL